MKKVIWSLILVLGVMGGLLKAQEVVKDNGEIKDVGVIVEKANHAAYYQGEDGKAKVKMTIKDKNGNERYRQFNILRSDVVDGGDQKYYVYFEKPEDVRRMVYLVHKHTGKGDGGELRDDDRWLYLPSLDLVKRVAAGDKRTSFVGSDFLYEDVSGRGLAEDVHELVDAEGDYYVVKNTPKKPETVEFSYYNVHIDKKNFVPMKMEYFDKGGKLYRTIESLEVKKIESKKDGEKVEYPTVVKSVVKDLNSGSRTEMEFFDIEYNIKPGDIFTERYLRRPPREAIR